MTQSDSSVPLGLGRYARDVLELDKKFGFNKIHECTLGNLSFFTIALCGEVGELANKIKKLLRDGETPELWDAIDEELVDVLIYMVEFMVVARVDFDKAWNEKHEELYKRFMRRAAEHKQAYKSRPEVLSRSSLQVEGVG